MDLKRLLLGKALRNEQLSGEKLSRMWGLPIMASDAVSSVAYAVEEILMALTPMLGMLAVNYVGIIALPIILLLMILVFSYSQIISHYPNGGGSYIVSKENFGTRSSLLAAACLVIDYIMTVAVSISSSTAAIVAAFPALDAYRVPISIVCVALVTLINLRGISESSKVFGIPTYAFIAILAALIIAGLVQWLGGTLEPIAYAKPPAAPDALTSMTVLLFLRAFSSGCSALTGVEAVSNAIPSFRAPAQRTAKHVLYMLGGVIVFLFGGTCLLAMQLRVLPVPETTVLSQMAHNVFGEGILYYALQFTTSLVLLLAANTAYNGLPILLSLLAKDHFMPHQFTQRGTKLSFSNGIVFLGIVSAILLAAFQADTHRLIPFYAVGVFVSFTLSQAGMFIKWARLKEKGWHHRSIINLFGALVTFVGAIVVFVTKFAQGAWALLLIVPLIIWFMSVTHGHYVRFAQQIGANEPMTQDAVRQVLRAGEATATATAMPCIVLMQGINHATLKALRYALDLSSDVTALHIATNEEHAQALQERWHALGIGVPLVLVPAPYREILGPLDAYIAQRESALGHGERLTVIMTKYVGNGGPGDLLFHNQTTFFIERKLGRHKDVATVFVPYVYQS